MKVSVVIPVYNGADFIQKSYQAIQNQQLTDFEIIYVDNNSTDTSSDQVRELMQLDSRVSLYFQTKQGAGPTRNLGIAHATGDYIYLLDIDDDIYPNAINTMLAVLEAHSNLEAVFGKMVKSDQSIAKTPKPSVDTFDVVMKSAPYWGLRWFSNLKYVVGPPAFLYRRTVFERIGGYNEALRVGQDTAFDIKLGMLCDIAFLDMYVYLYYKHQVSTTHIVKNTLPRAFMVWPRLVNEHLPFYLEHEVPARFKQLLFAQLYQSLGRQLLFTKGLRKRAKLREQLLSDLQAIAVPIDIRAYLVILVLFPFEPVGKVYRYVIVRRELKRLKAHI